MPELKNEGERNRTAAKAYGRDQKKSAESSKEELAKAAAEGRRHSHGEDPRSHGGDPRSHGGTPGSADQRSHGGDPRSPGGDPRAKR